MQQVLALSTVNRQHLDGELSESLGLKQAPLLPGGSGNVEAVMK
jgi:hypothetical protein